MRGAWDLCVLCALVILLPCQCEQPTSTRTNDDSILAVNKLIRYLKTNETPANHDQSFQNKISKIFQYATPKEIVELISDTRKYFMKRDWIDPDAKRDLTELIANQGFPVQKFVVQTKDGFLLDLHRIPYGRNDSGYTKKRPVVFLQHGLLSSAADWIMNFANDSLGFILADNGYDVWMGNSRGNTYSRRHVTLKPHDDRFWDWSFDEMAKYDTTAFIDFILNKTCQSSLHYVGHSQGTITAFALLASQPEYQKKIRLFVGLAPIISLSYIKSPLKYMGVLSDKEKYMIFGYRDFMPNDLLMKFFVDTICENRVSKWICSNIEFLLCGYDVSNLNNSRLTVYMNHSPAGSSTKNMVHFAQFYKAKKFGMYDYNSPRENLEHYGQTVPPLYNASLVKVPALIFTATNDWLADPKDVAILKETLPNIVASYNIPPWNHLDFIWGMDAAKLCYNTILKWLPKY